MSIDIFPELLQILSELESSPSIMLESNGTPSEFRRNSSNSIGVDRSPLNLKSLKPCRNPSEFIGIRRNPIEISYTS
jgi:hypothetical protein